MHITRPLLLSTLTLLATASTTTTTTTTATSLSAAESTKVIQDLEAYLTSLTAQPEYTSAAQMLQTALPSSVLSDIEADPSDFFNSIVTATATPDWYSAIPTSYQSYFSSIGAAEASIVNEDAKGPAPTNGVKLAGMAVAAGGVALALL